MAGADPEGLYRISDFPLPKRFGEAGTDSKMYESFDLSALKYYKPRWATPSSPGVCRKWKEKKLQ